MANLNLKKTPQLLELLDDSKVVHSFDYLGIFTSFVVYGPFTFFKLTGYGRVDESTPRKDLVEVDEFPFEEGRVQKDCN